MPYHNRVYYRNTFLHIGHLQTLCYNNDIAKQNNGMCYAIVDDRQHALRSFHISEDIKYLGLDQIKVISVMEHAELIHIYTKELARIGDVYINNDCNTIDCLDHPSHNFQIRLNYRDKPTIGYSKRIEDDTYIIIYIFDYIIKVLDDSLNITNVITTTPQDIVDNDIMEFFTELSRQNNKVIRYNALKTYRILGFRYTKRDWPKLKEDDMRLMTIRGMKARHIPPEVIYSFYKHAVKWQEHSDRIPDIKITVFDMILKNYLGLNSRRAFAVIDPLEVEITNMEDRCTEYILKPHKQIGSSDKFNIVPLSNRVFIEKRDFSLVECPDKISKDKEIKLKYANMLYCTDVKMDEDGYPRKLKAKYYKKDSDSSRCIHWISSESGSSMRQARFMMYDWFYTGENEPNTIVIKDGYIDEYVFDDLTQIYQLERQGYFAYDEDYTKCNGGIPTFIKICGIRHYYKKHY